MSETKGQTFNESPRYLLQDMERDGLLRQVITRRGTLCWVPTVLDDQPGEVRGARSQRGGRSSDIARSVDALLDAYNVGTDRARRGVR